MTTDSCDSDTQYSDQPAAVESSSLGTSEQDALRLALPATPFEVSPEVDGEVVAPISEAEAMRLDKRIRLMVGQFGSNLTKLRALLELARAGQAHTALGYASWTAYVADVGSQLQITPEMRPDVVGLLASAGMSTRAIAEVTGVSQSTIWREQTGDSFGSTDSGQAANADEQLPLVTGLDGKTYARRGRTRRPPQLASRRTNPAKRKALLRALQELHDQVELLDQLADDALFWAWLDACDPPVDDVLLQVTARIEQLKSMNDRVQQVVSRPS